MKHFIWDFDGTLFDSYPHSATAFCRMLEEHHKGYRYEEVQEALQVTYGHAYETYALTEEQIADFNRYAKDPALVPLITPFPDAEKTLRCIAEHGGKHYVYSHRDEESTLYYLKQYGLDCCFSYYVTADNGFARKPSPEGVNHIVEKFNLPKDQAIMIGDRELDALSGINAGIFGGLVVRGKVPADTQATHVFADLWSIHDLVNG